MRSPVVLPCRVQSSTARLCPCIRLRARIVANNNRRLRDSLHQPEEHAQCLVKLTAFRCAEALALLYSVLMNCVTRGFYSFRKFGEIEFDDSSVVQLLPGGVGHNNLPVRVQGSAGKFREYCASASFTLTRSRMCHLSTEY